MAHLLLHRSDLLDDVVPVGLAAALGLPDATALLLLGRETCEGTQPVPTALAGRP